MQLLSAQPRACVPHEAGALPLSQKYFTLQRWPPPPFTQLQPSKTQRKAWPTGGRLNMAAALPSRSRCGQHVSPVPPVSPGTMWRQWAHHGSWQQRSNLLGNKQIQTQCHHRVEATDGH